jgi:hypothetical protein
MQHVQQYQAAEAAQRQAQAQALLDLSRALNPPPPPTINCTSNTFGSTTNTTCQ